MGLGHAQALWLKAAGYEHPELRHCVLELVASGDRASVDGIEAERFVVDRDRAVADALQLLATPGIMTAIEAVADQLLAVREMTGDQGAVILDQNQIVRPQTV